MSYARGNLWSSIGRGLRDTGNLVGGLRERDRRQELEEEELKRRQQMHEVGLFQAGARSEAPTVDRQLVGTGPRPDEFEAPEFIPEPGDRQPVGADNMLGDIDLGVEPRTEPITVQETAPGWEQIGDHYFEDPDQRATRLERERMESLIGDLGPAADRLGAGELQPGDEGYGREALRLGLHGVNPDGLRPPDDPAWQQQAEFFRDGGVSLREQMLGREPVPGRGSAPRGMSSGDATSFVKDIFGEWDGDLFAGYRISPAEAATIVRGLVNGNPEVEEYINTLAEGLTDPPPGGDDGTLAEPGQEEGPGLLARARDFVTGFGGRPSPEALTTAQEAMDTLMPTLGPNWTAQQANSAIEAAAREYNFTPEEQEAMRWMLENEYMSPADQTSPFGGVRR